MTRVSSSERKPRTRQKRTEAIAAAISSATLNPPIERGRLGLRGSPECHPARIVRNIRRTSVGRQSDGFGSTPLRSSAGSTQLDILFLIGRSRPAEGNLKCRAEPPCDLFGSVFGVVNGITRR